VHTFAEALCEKAREGVQVRLLYDWFGAIGKTSQHFWKNLRDAGVIVRCFNPFQFGSPLKWLSRDHRKLLTVDSRIGFVTGLCVGQPWIGDVKGNGDPWRDTGIEIRGPAVADLEQAFAQTWAAAGPPLSGQLPRRDELPMVGDVPVRVVASEPSTAGLYRLDTLIGAIAQHSLWLTDAYFVGTTVYVQALIAAAHDGVDVRLLVPGSSDIPWIRALSCMGYRPLLEGGIRVFEWNGSMLHAKTAVADGRWARVGSTNLNPSSLLGNWELDAAVEDEGFAHAMEEMFLEDLTNATEVLLSAHRRVRLVRPSPNLLRHRRKRRSSSTRRVVAGALGISNAVGAAITNHRPLGPAEAKVMTTGGAGLLVIAVVGLLWPLVIALPLCIVGLWLSIELFVRAAKLHRQKSQARALINEPLHERAKLEPRSPPALLETHLPQDGQQSTPSSKGSTG
jgi:cardiolipin synthase